MATKKRYRIYSTIVKVYEVIAETEDEAIQKLSDDDVEEEWIKDEEWDLRDIKVIKEYEEEEED